MQLFKLWSLATLVTAALAAKKPRASTYDKYVAKHASSTPLELDEASYNELSASPRNYSVAILLTALDAKYACGICKEFDPEWKAIARSWRNADKNGEHRMLFGQLDFEKGRQIFMSMSLQTAPVLMVFPANTGPGASGEATAARHDFLGPQTAEQIHAFIVRHLPPGEYPKLKRPVNYARIVSTITIIIGVFTFGTVAYPYILPVVQNRNLWAAVSLILVLMFTSGHMFNHIRKVPYVSGDKKGGITYFAGGFSNQLGIETQIIAAIYGVLSFALIALALKVPRIQDARAQQVACIIWAGVIFGMYSFLMSVFRIKNGGYPFWLPPF